MVRAGTRAVYGGGGEGGDEGGGEGAHGEDSVVVGCRRGYEIHLHRAKVTTCAFELSFNKTRTRMQRDDGPVVATGVPVAASGKRGRLRDDSDD